MANTITTKENTIECLMDGSSDLSLATELSLSVPIKIKRIDFIPTTANDSVVVRDGDSATGPVLWSFKDTAGSGHGIDYPEGYRCRPYIVGSEVTTGCEVIFALS